MHYHNNAITHKQCDEQCSIWKWVAVKTLHNQGVKNQVSLERDVETKNMAEFWDRKYLK